jgi:hypothetical protein
MSSATTENRKVFQLADEPIISVKVSLGNFLRVTKTTAPLVVTIDIPKNYILVEKTRSYT